MKKLTLLCLLFTSFLSAQENFTTSGIIKDSKDGETVYGATVYLKDTTIGALSNEYGFYSISAPEGTYILVVSFLGYSDIEQEIRIKYREKTE